MKKICNLRIGDSITINASNINELVNLDKFHGLNDKYIDKDSLIEVINKDGDKFEFKVSMIFAQHILLSPNDDYECNFLKLLHSIFKAA